jgi:hypothetical protein
VTPPVVKSAATSERVTRHDFLQELHRAYQPRSYLEIGINAGYSLTLSRARTIAVDPAFKITSELHCDLQVVKATSDDFFAREDALAHFPDRSVDLAFVDGLHLFEFALRDFINVERHADWSSVIIVDDVLPRSVVEASRERLTTAWTGDVFKLTEVLARYRPDLVLLPLDTRPTGVLLVLGANPRRTVLSDQYDAIVAEHVYPDPQRVPEAVLRRENAIDPASIIGSSVLAELRLARDSGVAREDGWEDLRRSFEAAARPAERRGLKPAQLSPVPARPVSPSAQGKARRKVKAAPPPTASRRALQAVRRRLRPLRRRVRSLSGGRI